MVGWFAFGFALLVAVIVLGFCAYELRWKRARLNADLETLNADVRALGTVGEDLTAAQARLARVRAQLRD